MTAISVNGRDYPAPKNPTVVICIDGSEPGYIEKAIEAGCRAEFRPDDAERREPHRRMRDSFIHEPQQPLDHHGPPPAVHGIAGNFFYDPATGKEVMMNDPSFLRAPTILAGVQQAGTRSRW